MINIRSWKYENKLNFFVVVVGGEVGASFTAGIIVGGSYSAQKIKFFIKDLFSKCDQTAVSRRFGHIY